MEGSPVSSVSRNRNPPHTHHELQDLTGPHFLHLQSREPLVITPLLQPAWEGAPPSAAGVKGQKAEGGADKGRLQGWGGASGQGHWMDCALEGKGQDEGGRVTAHGTKEKVRQGQARSLPTENTVGHGRGWLAQQWDLAGMQVTSPKEGGKDDTGRRARAKANPAARQRKKGSK